ncbi:MAG: exodeoxyribonuclease VII large subunit, partial [Woeseiaceae bacterium]
AMRQRRLQENNRLQTIRGRLVQLSPAMSVQRSIAHLAALRQRLATVTRTIVSTADHRASLLGRALHSVSPLATLDRGYAIVTEASSNRVVLRARDVGRGDEIRARLSKGELVATVSKVIDRD